MKKTPKANSSNEALTQSPGDSDGISTSTREDSRRANKNGVEQKSYMNTDNAESPATGMRSPGLLRENKKGKDVSHP